MFTHRKGRTDGGGQGDLNDLFWILKTVLVEVGKPKGGKDAGTDFPEEFWEAQVLTPPGPGTRSQSSV